MWVYYAIGYVICSIIVSTIWRLYDRPEDCQTDISRDSARDRHICAGIFWPFIFLCWIIYIIFVGIPKKICLIADKRSAKKEVKKLKEKTSQGWYR